MAVSRAATLSVVGVRLLRHWAVSLGAPEGTFDSAVTDRPATLIKVVRYPGTSDTSQGVGVHKDSGLLTLLLLEQKSDGLQVEAHAGQWIDVLFVPLAIASSRHHRISIPFFLNPALDATVPIISLPAELAALSRGVEAELHHGISEGRR